MEISQDLLQHSLGASVGIGNLTLGTFLCNGDLCRIAVYRCRRAEYNVLYAVISHLITQDQRSCNIIVIIFQRLLNGFTYCL